MNARPIHIMVLGLRGFPNIQGGVEVHVQNLFSIIASAGYRVTAIVRTPYIGKDHPNHWQGIDFVRIWSPRTKSLEAIVHTFFGVLYAACFCRPDILHIHAIGPSLVVPFARLLGLKVVVTHHGMDYDRQKWGLFAKKVLRLGESWGMKTANGRIVISKTIHDHVLQKHAVSSVIIPNGVTPWALRNPSDILSTFALLPRQYILMVGRFVPEKRQGDLVNAFKAANPKGWKLVFVGAADHESSYAQSVLDMIGKTPDAVATGPLFGDDLATLYDQAGIFVLPSSHEGLPIVLLEALSYGIPVLVSDIPAHTEIELPPEHYFVMGDAKDLASHISYMAATCHTEAWRQNLRDWVLTHYDWKKSARQTLDVYRAVLE